MFPGALVGVNLWLGRFFISSPPFYSNALKHYVPKKDRITSIKVAQSIGRLSYERVKARNHDHF